MTDHETLDLLKQRLRALEHQIPQPAERAAHAVALTFLDRQIADLGRKMIRRTAWIRAPQRPARAS